MSQPKAPRSSMTKELLENVNKPVKKKERKSNPLVTRIQEQEQEPEPQRSDVVISYPETGGITYDVHGRGAKTKEELEREYKEIGEKYNEMMNLGGKRTRKRKRRRKRKTRKRKSRRTKKRRKSRRRKRRRTRK